MRKLLLAAVAGTAFALAGCSEKPVEPTTEAAVESEAAPEASGSAEAEAPAAEASAPASEAPKM